VAAHGMSAARQRGGGCRRRLGERGVGERGQRR
jgi:hypothetical protein